MAIATRVWGSFSMKWMIPDLDVVQKEAPVDADTEKLLHELQEALCNQVPVIKRNHGMHKGAEAALALSLPRVVEGGLRLSAARNNVSHCHIGKYRWAKDVVPFLRAGRPQRKDGAVCLLLISPFFVG